MKRRRLLRSNNSTSLRRRMLDGTPIYIPNRFSAIPARGNITGAFTRAGVKNVPDFEGRQYQALSGERCFWHVRRIENLWTTSSVSLASGANKSLTLAAGAYQFSMGAGTGTATFSGTGGATGTLAASASARTWVAKTITAGTLVITASVADLADLQVVSMVGVTDQTTLREYVSVGVASAPYYHGSMVDGVKCFGTDYSGNPLPTSEIATYPMRGAWDETAATQLIAATADIRDMTTASWTLGATMTRARTSVGIDGVANMATRLTGGAVAATNTITYTLVAAASSRTYSVWIKRITGTGPVRLTQDNFATNSDISGQLVSGRWVQVLITQSQLNAVFGIKVDTNGDAIDVDCNQFEAGTAATSRILTGGATRPADVMTYTGADVAPIKAMSCTFWRPVGVSAVGTISALSDGTTANYAQAVLSSAIGAVFQGGASSVEQWNRTASNTYTPGTQSKMAWSMATNNILMDKDATAQTTDTTATIPAISQINQGHVAGSFQLNGATADLYFWHRNLSQSELGAVDK